MQITSVIMGLTWRMGLVQDDVKVTDNGVNINPFVDVGHKNDTNTIKAECVCVCVCARARVCVCVRVSVA